MPPFAPGESVVRSMTELRSLLASAAASAPLDPMIGSGALDVSADLQPGAKPREVKVPLSLPIGDALHASGLSEQINGTLAAKGRHTVDVHMVGSPSSEQPV